MEHHSCRPDRPDMIGEVVFSRRWRELMEGGPAEDPGTVLADILFDVNRRDEPTQRQATIAATFVQWLGTNVGAAFLLHGRKIRDAGLSGPFAFGAAWADQNLRRAMTNEGRRTSEYLLAPMGVEACSCATDLEVLDHVARWIGSADGERFVREAEAEIEIRRDAVDKFQRYGAR